MTPPATMVYVLTTVWNSEQTSYRFARMHCRPDGRAYDEPRFRCRSLVVNRRTGRSVELRFLVLADGAVVESDWKAP